MERAELIKLKIKALLNETAAVKGENSKKPRWRERLLVMALILQSVALLSAMTTREPLYLGMDPYGNPVTAVERPLTGKVYREVNYTPGTQLIPSQDELKKRTALDFRF